MDKEVTKQTILDYLRTIKPIFEKEGVLFLGLFGSFSTGKETQSSDIDILIETTDVFLNKYKGFKAFVRLDEIKKELKNFFKREIDFADKKGLLQNNNDYILKKAIYV